MSKRKVELRVFHPSNDDPNAVSALILGALHMASELSSDHMARLNAYEANTAMGKPEWAGPIMSSLARLENLSEFVELNDLDEYRENDAAEKKLAAIRFLTVVAKELWQDLQYLLYESMLHFQALTSSTVVVSASPLFPDALLSAINACAEEILFDDLIFEEESRKRFAAIAYVAALPRLTVPQGAFESRDVLRIPIQTDVLVGEAFQQAKRVLLLDDYVQRIRFGMQE